MKGIQYNYIENNTNIKTELIIVGGMIAVTLASAIVLSSVRVNADTDAVDEVSITVPSACTMSGNIATGNEHTASINPNTYQDNIGKTTITTFCNDAGGYAIYAIGYTGDQYTGDDHTKLIGTNTNQKISTGTAKTGTSQWAMRITPVTGTYTPTIENSYDSENYHIVPDTYEKVATYGNSTDATGGTGSSIETTYAAYISGTQAADTYTSKVKYTLVHPSVAAAPELPVAPEETATLVTGDSLCFMMSELAGDYSDCNGEDAGEQVNGNTTIKSIRMASSLPDNFVVSANNTVSDEDSYNPIYIFFDNIDDAGIIYFYTPARKIYMNEYSYAMFGNLNALTDISGVASWDASRVTDMDFMFHKSNVGGAIAENPASINLTPVANWDTSSVTSMAYLFYGNSSVNNIEALSGWETSAVTRMISTFSVTSSLSDINALASWDTSAVTDMSSMFAGATALTDISALSRWDTSSVTKMPAMFINVDNIDATVLNGWNVSNVTNKFNMFTCPVDKRPNWY